VYERGVRVAEAAFRTIATRLARSPTRPTWSPTIQPKGPGDELPAPALRPAAKCPVVGPQVGSDLMLDRAPHLVVQIAGQHALRAAGGVAGSAEGPQVAAESAAE